MIHWGAKHLLLLLWAIVPIAWFIFRALKYRKKRLSLLFAPEVIPTLAPLLNSKRAKTRNIFWLLAITLCLLALARPQWGFHWEEVKRRGLDIMVVLDTSRSMLAEDILPNRLQQAKWGIRDLVNKLHSDRIGLVTFSGSSFLQCPLTVDYAAFLMTLDDVYVGIIPRGGTAIEQALKKAMESFEGKAAADKVIVLITDGEDHEGKPKELISELKKKQIRVYAIGVGTKEGELIPLPGNQGQTDFLKDREGKVVKSSLNEDELTQIALSTEGMYVRSAAGDFGFEKIYDQGINQLQRADLETRMVKTYEDRFIWPLLLALVLLIIEATLGDRITKLRRHKASTLLLIGIIFVGLTSSAQADSARVSMDAGLKNYLAATNGGRPQEQRLAYEEAQSDFKKAGEQATQEKLDPALAFFNEGNALYRLGQFPQANQAYQSALKSPQLSLQGKAYYNQGNSWAATAAGLEQQQKLDEAIKAIDEALATYEKSILLDPADPAAKINYELAQKKKEELNKKKKQQEQQQKQQQQQQQQNKQDQEQKDQEKKDQPPPKEEQKPEDQNKKPEDQQKKPEEPPKNEADQGNPPPQPPKEKANEEMTPQQAKMLLDAMKEEEKTKRDKMRLFLGQPEAVDKDW